MLSDGFLCRSCDDHGAYQCRDGNGEDNTDAAGDTADDLNGEEGGAQKKMRLESERIELNDEHEAAADEGEYQSVGHGAHHITAYVHSAAEESLFPH